MKQEGRDAPLWRSMETWGAPGGLLLLVLIVFPGAFLQGRVFFERDIQGFWYPAIEAFVRAIHEGSWPVWNPYPAFGVPMLPDPNYQIAYPLTWLNLILPPDRYFKLFVLVHCVGGGLGLHRLCRRRGLGLASSFLGACLWISSGPLLSSISLFHHFAGAAWMPWVLLALDVALARGTVGSALILAAAAAGQALAGSADLCFMTALLAAGWTCAFALRDPGPRRWPRIALVLAVSIPLAALIAAVQWFPAAVALSWGTRSALGPPANLYWSVHPLSLLDLFVPRLIADAPLSPVARAALFESREPLLVSLYLGLAAGVVLACAILARCLPKGAIWAGSGLILFLTAALGRHTPLLRTLAHLVPFSFFRYPTKYMLPASLLWAALVALAFEGWQRTWGSEDRRRAGWFAVLLALTAAASLWGYLSPATRDTALQGLTGWLTGGGHPWPALAGQLARLAAVLAACSLLLWLRARAPASPFWITTALGVVLLGETVLAARGVCPTAPPELLRYRPRVLQELRKTSEPRVHVLQQPLRALSDQLTRLPVGWEPRWGWVLGSQDMLWPPLGGRWQVRGSYDGDFSGLAPPGLSVLGWMIRRTDSSDSLRLLQMGSVDYVVSLKPSRLDDLPEVAEFMSVYTTPIVLFRVPDPVSKAYVVGRSWIATEPESYGIVRDPGFDPRVMVVVSGGRALVGAPEFRGRAQVLERRSDRVVVETESSSLGYLVLAESYHPGWRATVDGAAVGVERANILFRAVLVPAGRHRVELRYRPPGLLPGLVLSAASVAFGLVLCGVRWHKRHSLERTRAEALGCRQR